MMLITFEILALHTRPSKEQLRNMKKQFGDAEGELCVATSKCLPLISARLPSPLFPAYLPQILPTLALLDVPEQQNRRRAMRSLRMSRKTFDFIQCI